MHLPDDLPAWLSACLLPPHLPMAPGEGDRLSAVLLPVVARPTGATLLMVRKSSRLLKHAGQLGFPGGSLDVGETVEAAALREAHEEVGLDPLAVQLLGRLDEDRTIVTSYHIAPLVGWIAEPPEQWVVDAYEIESVLEVSLREVLNAEPVSWLEYTVENQVYRAPKYEFSGDVVVWGASARILLDFQRRLRILRPV